MKGKMTSFRWYGSEYLADAGCAPPQRLLETLAPAVKSGAPDALVWDDVSIDYYPRQRRLRLVRTQASVFDANLQAQIAGYGRTAVKVERLRQLKAAGSLADDAGPSEMLQWLVKQDPGGILRLSGHYRFAGPAFERRYETCALPVPPKVAGSIAVVLNYRDHSDVTITCLEHLAGQVLTADIELLIVDNRSSLEERTRVDNAIARLFPAGKEGTANYVRVRHLLFDAPFNLSYQNNFAVAQTSAEVILLLNNDCYLLDPDCIQTLANWAMTPEVGSVAPRMLGRGGRLMTAGVNAGVDFGTGKERIWECEFHPLSKLMHWTAANSTACAAINRDAWFDVGGMDACFFPSQYDDADLCLRMSRRGWKHLYVGAVAVFHEPGTTEERKKADIAKLMHELLARHDLSDVALGTPAFEVLQKVPMVANDDAGIWSAFVGYFRQFIGWKKQHDAHGSIAGSEQLLEAWAELQRMSDMQEGIPDGSAEADAWYRVEQCRLMLQCVFVCRSYIECCGDKVAASDDALSAVESHLHRELAASSTHAAETAS